MTWLTHSAAPTQRVYSLSQAISAFTLIANRIMSYPASPFNGFLQLSGYRMDTHASLRELFRGDSTPSCGKPCSSLSVPDSAWTTRGSHAGEAFCHSLMLSGDSSQVYLNSSFQGPFLGNLFGKILSDVPRRARVVHYLPPALRHLSKTKKVNYLNACIWGHESKRYSIFSPEKLHSR